MFSLFTTSLLQFISSYPSLMYSLLFVGLLLEGEAVLFVAAFLAHQGYLNPGPTAFIAYLGTFLGDYLWYALGKKISKKDNRLAFWVQKVTKPLSSIIPKHPEKALFLTKFMYGLHRATLIKIGMEKLASRRFIKADIPAVALWVTLVGFFAFLFSSSLKLVRHYLKYTEIILLLGILIFFLIGHISAKLLSKEILKKE